MTSDDYEKRFGGMRRLHGDAAYRCLPELHFCVVGLGGVGSWAVEALARSGVGRITLIDFDNVCLTNTNRQLGALTSTVGRKKHEVLKDRVLDINPHCACYNIDDFLTDRTLDDYLSRDYDYVIDAIDSIKFKAAMINHCKRNKIPLIVTGGAGGLTDPTLIQISDLTRTFNDALLAKVRAQLRKDYGFSRKPKARFGIECIFSSQQPVYPQANGCVSHAKPGVHGVSLDCRFGYGSASYVTAAFGFNAAARAINKALNRKLKSAESDGSQ